MLILSIYTGKREQSLIFSSLETTDSSNSIINSGEG